MNITSNEWMEINVQQGISDLIEPFISPLTQFLYPKRGEKYTLRFLGAFAPYYRAYIDPNLRWIEIANGKQFKECLKGNKESILDVARRLIDKSGDNYRIIDGGGSIVPCKQAWNYNPNSIENLNALRVNFLNSCLTDPCSRNIWSACAITNAYVKSGPRYNHTLQPLAVTRSMFSGAVRNPIPNVNLGDCIASQISGINAVDFLLARENVNKSPAILRMTNPPNPLKQEDLAAIMKLRLINIPAFVKSNNEQSISNLCGYVHRPFTGMRDAVETLNILMEAKTIDENEQYEAVENDLCNIPQNLVNEKLYEDGPISSIEIV